MLAFRNGPVAHSPLPRETSRVSRSVPFRTMPSPAMLALVAAATGLVSPSAWAQEDVPPPPVPSEAPPASSTANTAAPAAAPAAAAPAPAAPAASAAPAATATATASASTDPYAPAAAADPYAASTAAAAPGSEAPATPAAPGEEYEAWAKRNGLRKTGTISGSTGLMRTREPGSGEAGTFRLGFLGSYFGATGFLCNEYTGCRDPVTGSITGPDDSRRSEQILSLSVTPFSFLEVFGTLRNSAISNSNGRPRVLQVVGDSSLGVKGFLPAEAERIFSVGAEAELSLMTGSGSVGLAGDATGIAFRALGGMDLSQRSAAADRIPLRALFNFGYVFDNSAAIVRSLETTPPPTGRGEPIQRTERFGLNISRVDNLEMGLAVEYLNDYVRPFVDWSLEIPVNRQNYTCNISGAASRGDLCLKLASYFNAIPHRLTLGARVFPWQESGLAVTAAVDIGTGGTQIFTEEVTPEAPYSLWLGLGYAVDTRPPKPVEVPVLAPVAAPAPAAEPQRFISGFVVDEASGAPIPGALVLYEDPSATGMVTNSSGAFLSANLAAGEYKFKVQAPTYKDGECAVAVPATVDPAVPEAATAAATEPVDPYAPPEPAAEPGAPVATAATKTEKGDLLVPLQCSLKELPRVANMILILVDAETGAIVPDGAVTITDKLNRSLELKADTKGSLQFKNVPFGTAQLVADAPGYLRALMPAVVDSRKDIQIHFVMNRRPTKLGVKVLPKAISLMQPIEFVGDTDQVSPQSSVVIEQLAALLREDPKVGAVEIGVHSDDTGAASYAHQLTQARADNIRLALIRLGVAEAQVTAKGYGPDQPLAPNTTDEGRAKNNRVEVVRKP